MNFEELVYNPKVRYAFDTPIDQIIDETTATCVYVGWTFKTGAAGSEAAWLIKRIKVDGAITYIGWAGSPDKRDNIWDNRDALTYTQGG